MFPFSSYLSSHKSVSAVTSWVLVSLLCEIKYVNCQDRTPNICMNILTVRLGHSEEHSTGIFEVIRIIFIDLSRDRLQPDLSLPQVYKNINVGRGRVSVSLDSTGPHLPLPPPPQGRLSHNTTRDTSIYLPSTIWPQDLPGSNIRNVSISACDRRTEADIWFKVLVTTMGWRYLTTVTNLSPTNNKTSLRGSLTL